MDPVNNAFDVVDRKDFVPESLRDLSNIDSPLPIGHGQTISQPYTVRLMLGWLGAQPKERVLDVGSGSGWTSALLSQIVGPEGKVFAVERIPELLEMGKNNCDNIGIKNVGFFQAGKTYGLPDHSPYDRILVSASAKELPIDLISQLKVGGKMVIPIQENVLEITKTTNDDYTTKTHPGFVFVPLL